MKRSERFRSSESELLQEIFWVVCEGEENLHESPSPLCLSLHPSLYLPPSLPPSLLLFPLHHSIFSSPTRWVAFSPLMLTKRREPVRVLIHPIGSFPPPYLLLALQEMKRSRVSSDGTRLWPRMRSRCCCSAPANLARYTSPHHVPPNRLTILHLLVYCPQADETHSPRRLHRAGA
jgi:hypothetical protein